MFVQIQVKTTDRIFYRLLSDLGQELSEELPDI